jgi:probable F420-dependent oxidoreductase
MFNPGPTPYGTPRIVLGGVGAKMVELAGEVADGLLVHPLNTRRFLETVTRPAIERGLAASGRARSVFTLACQTLVVTGANAEEYAMNRELVRSQIAFYASTPAYRCVLDAEGWGELQPVLRDMTRAGNWIEMRNVITDPMLDTIASTGTPEEVADKLWHRYGGVADRIALASPFPLDADSVRRIVTKLRAFRGVVS